ncbi:MAG: ABC transporter substrate-binding protein [Oligoflexia bacterium]|nr:ABC transporter substrate-binding protein [Oligoflexia bacterium]
MLLSKHLPARRFKYKIFISNIYYQKFIKLKNFAGVQILKVKKKGRMGMQLKSILTKTLIYFSLSIFFTTIIFINPKICLAKDQFIVGILQMVDSMESAVTGFKDGMKELGYIEGKKITYKYYNAKGDLIKLKGLSDTLINDSELDLIFVCSTPATRALKKASEENKKSIPILFTPVSNPLSSGIVKSLKTPTENITGVSSGIVTGKQLRILKEINPNIKKVLIIAKEGDSSAEDGINDVKNTLEQAKKSKDDILNDIELTVKFAINKDKAQKFIEGNDFSKVDVIHIMPDTMVSELLDLIYSKTKKLNIPIIVWDPILLKKGGFLSYVSNYYLLAKNQTSKQADKILKGKKKISEIFVEEPSEYFLHLNLEAINFDKNKLPAKYKNIAKFE